LLKHNKQKKGIAKLPKQNEISIFLILIFIRIFDTDKNKMKKIIVSSLFVASGFLANAQIANDDYYPSLKPKLLSADRVSASLMAGTSVSFSNKYNSVSTFIAPKISYQLTDKFHLIAGLIHYTSYPNSLLQNGNEKNNCGQKNYSSNLVFAGGEYQLSTKLTVSGAVLTNASSISNKQTNYKAASIGLDYKVSKHSSIGIQAGISQGSPDYIFNPAKNSYYYNPSNDKTNGILSPLGQWGIEALSGAVK
jgi:hypothetical protein